MRRTFFDGWVIAAVKAVVELASPGVRSAPGAPVAPMVLERARQGGPVTVAWLVHRAWSVATEPWPVVLEAGAERSAAGDAVAVRA
jgi:hypothetical protein